MNDDNLQVYSLLLSELLLQKILLLLKFLNFRIHGEEVETHGVFKNNHIVVADPP